MSMEPGTSEPYSFPTASPRPFWTLAKMIALVLVVVIAVSAVGAGVYYAVSPVRPSNHCGSGATNYPSCTTCSSGQTLVNGTATATARMELRIHLTVIITVPTRQAKPVRIVTPTMAHSASLSTSAMLNTRRIPLVGILPSTFKTTVQIEVSRYHQFTLTKQTNRQQNLFTSTSTERLFPAHGLSQQDMPLPHRSIPVLHLPTL